MGKTEKNLKKRVRPNEASVALEGNSDRIEPNDLEVDTNVKEKKDDLYGKLDVDAKEWTWDFGKDLRLRVGTFRGKPFVDIRHLWSGHATKKGVFLSIEAFKEIQKWPCLEEALTSTGISRAHN
ncbi:uncharacterized protein LOC128883646 [Hylaeus volcanicus]|uniref:uncharacterized protein LOC128883646 n=1 Tax=Hylaeus volcanicus TaxID=313075 RepID=UPI0023B78ADB|nr:uncharacterized protein LOC128883646 [Hylaeus volcanicus]